MKISQHLLPLTLTVATSFALSAQAIASDLTNFNTISQTEFLALSKDLAAATNNKPLEPAAPLGITGFDVSAAASDTKTQAGNVWKKVSGDNVNNFVQTKLSVSKGLPGGWDVGGFISKASSSNVTVSGVHVKYALLEGNVITPAIAVRGSHSRMGGVSGMDLNNTGLDLLISKGFVGITPYAGVGIVKSNAKANGLNNESFSQNKSFVGVSWNLLMLNLTAEYDRTGDASTYGVKAGLRF